MIIKYLSEGGMWRWIGRQQITAAKSFNHPYYIPDLVARLFAREQITDAPEKKYIAPAHMLQSKVVSPKAAPAVAPEKLAYLKHQVLTICAAHPEAYHDLMKLLDLDSGSRKLVFDFGERLAADGLADVRFRACRMCVRITEKGIEYLK